jgi:phospholipase/carboxylesterase
VTEHDRPLRVASALPRLLDRIDKLAAERGMERHDLVLLGFSQGAIMTLAMVAQGLHPGRAIAVAGRLATPTLPYPQVPASLLLVDDSDDPIMPRALSEDAAARLLAAGHHVDRAHTKGIGHGIGAATVSAIAQWLKTASPSQTVEKVIQA